MKERLIDIIDDFRQIDAPDDGRSWTEHLADHLLSNGVTISSISKSKEYHRKYRKTHPDKFRQYARKHYHEVEKNDPEAMAKRAEYHAKWQKENREKLCAYQRERREKKRSEKNERAIRTAST